MHLIADMGVALVNMDKEMFIKKCMSLLNDEDLYQEYRDHTKSFHSKVLKPLLDLKKNFVVSQFKINTSNPALNGYNNPPARYYIS